MGKVRVGTSFAAGKEKYTGEFILHTHIHTHRLMRAVVMYIATFVNIVNRDTANLHK